MMYSLGCKAVVLKKMVLPQNRPIAQLVEEEGILVGPFHLWRARAQGRVLSKERRDRRAG
jgi:hypothetical protein